MEAQSKTRDPEEFFLIIRTLTEVKRFDEAVALITATKMEFVERHDLKQCERLVKLFGHSFKKDNHSVEKCIGLLRSDFENVVKYRLSLETYTHRLYLQMIERVTRHLDIVVNMIMDKVFDYDSLVTVLGFLGDTYRQMAYTSKEM